MPEPVNEKVETIQRDLTCPKCEYNLRGLQGDIVHCPECGTGVDVARLITMKWAGPWHSAPGLFTIEIPVVWAVASPILIMFLVAMAAGISPRNQWAMNGGLMVGGVFSLGLWLWLVLRTRSVFNSMRGPCLSLLAHALMLGYIVSLSGFIGVLIMAVAGISNGNTLTLISAVVFAVGLVALFFGARWTEKWIASQCIREYLRRKTGQRESI